MELENFEFKRERKLGEFVQDFINLLKIIIVHVSTVLFRMLALPICGMLLVGYYISTQINLNVNYSSGEFFGIAMTFAVALISIGIIGMFAFGFSIEYFLLLRDRKALDFDQREVWAGFRGNIYKYVRFFLAAIVVGLIIMVPVGLIMLLAAFIPFLGSILLGVFTGILSLWFFTAFLLYREEYYDLTDTFTAAFSMLKSKIMEYGVASYVVSFLFQALMTLISIIPILIIFLISYNSVGFNNDFFDTYYGKSIVTGGSMLLTLFAILYYMLSVISYGIIYETAKELRFGEDAFERISKIGRRDNV